MVAPDPVLGEYVNVNTAAFIKVMKQTFNVTDGCVRTTIPSVTRTITGQARRIPKRKRVGGRAKLRPPHGHSG